MKELPNTRKLWVLVFPRAEEKLEPPQAMNALMKLNQLKPGLQYKLVSQTGPVHAPIFTMSVEIDGSTFEASGPSKKTAKLHVAVKVSAGFAGNGNGKTARPTRDRVGAAAGAPSPECPWSARGIGERRRESIDGPEQLPGELSRVGGARVRLLTSLPLSRCCRTWVCPPEWKAKTPGRAMSRRRRRRRSRWLWLLRP